jgi:hypothetical protein
VNNSASLAAQRKRDNSQLYYAGAPGVLGASIASLTEGKAAVGNSGETLQPPEKKPKL